MNYNRKIELRALLIVSIALCLAFFTLNRNYQRNIFGDVSASYERQTAINLSAGFDRQVLENLLVNGGFTDNKSAYFIARHIDSVLGRGALPNLGQLNTSRFQIPVSQINNDFVYFRNRIADYHRRFGITNELPSIESVSTSQDFGSANGSEIRVRVQKEQDANRILRRLGFTRTAPVDSVLVQLAKHADSISNGEIFGSERIIGYAKTNQRGIAAFTGLNPEGFYSVRPIRKGYRYGGARGTTRGNLGSMSSSERTFTFTQREHRITPFSAGTYASLRGSDIITARSPQEFQRAMQRSLLWILLAWWALHFFLAWRKKSTDQLLLPLLMLLTGICVLAMYAIQPPLTDLMHGQTMTQAVLWGIFAIFVLSNINVVTFFNSNYKFLGRFGGRRAIPFDIVRSAMIWFVGLFSRWLGEKPKNWISKLPEGAGYLVLALLLTALLFPFGSGPPGSGVRIELFFFQPGEVAKYLTVIFLAAFFYKNAEKIQTFSQTFTKTGFKIQLRTVIWTMLCIGALLLMYLLLGDMGPAMVIAVTFIVVYSVVRGDFVQCAAGVLSFLLFIFIASLISIPLFAAALLWLGLWLAYCRWRKQLFESAVFFNLVVAAFIFAAPVMNAVGLGSQAERLTARTEIALNIWDNEVRGGAHIAQGLWGLASGGIFGQGLGGGSPNLVPEHQTDMIFTSIGEEMGWFGLLLITFALAILLYRTMRIGQWNGSRFAFYLATGIAVVTGVQFLIITLGSVGIIPLTGITVPFLSFGRVSMIMNMAAFGLIFSISQSRAAQNQEIALQKYDLMIDTCKNTFGLIAAGLLLVLFYYQFNIGGDRIFGRNETLIRPALMANAQGHRVVMYNPRIHALMRELPAGNIYDRNKLLLATSDTTLIRPQRNLFEYAGVWHIAQSEIYRHHRHRHYTFGGHLFFWLGDFNQQRILFWSDNINDPRGYFAERRHLVELRGFQRTQYDADGRLKVFSLDARAHRYSPFLPPVPRTDARFVNYDYSELLRYLRAGIHSRRVRNFDKPRSLTLTVDAVLQARLQTEIETYVNRRFGNEDWRNKLRVSVVVMNANTGELLASANYPLPCMQTLEKMREPTRGFSIYLGDAENAAYTDRDLGLTFQTQPGSTAKIMSAMAAFQKLGVDARNQRFNIHRYELINRTIEQNIGTITAGNPNMRNVTMRDAIVHSSNVYFIDLVNSNDLYENLADIYWRTGIGFDMPENGGTRRFTPYFFTPRADSGRGYRFRNHITSAGTEAVMLYNRYVEERRSRGNFEVMAEWDARTRTHNPNWMREHAWAWGQGTMQASPLAMARVAAITASSGILPETQFVIETGENRGWFSNLTRRVSSSIEPNRQDTVLQPDAANVLREYMIAESARRNIFPETMGGKSGTAARGIMIEGRERNMNDGWYMFFIPSTKQGNPYLAVVVRMERIGNSLASQTAVPLANEVVLRVLRERGYVEFR